MGGGGGEILQVKLYRLCHAARQGSGVLIQLVKYSTEVELMELGLGNLGKLT